MEDRHCLPCPSHYFRSALVPIALTINGSPVDHGEGTTGTDLFKDDRDIVAMRVGGELKDLFVELRDGDVVEPVRIDSPEGLEILRHSCAHVLAQAVQQINPDAKLGIGAPITDEIYLALDVSDSFKQAD